MAAEREEVVGRPHPRQPQDLFPDPAEHLLDRAPLGHDRLRRQLRPRQLRRRQGLPVHLAVDGERQRLQENDARRHQRLGQLALERRPQLARRHLRPPTT